MGLGLLLKARVVGGVLMVDPLPDGFAPDGTEVRLRVVDMSNRCRLMFVPGVLRPPGSDRPDRRTRCCLATGHEGRHAWLPPGSSVPRELPDVEDELPGVRGARDDLDG